MRYWLPLLLCASACGGSSPTAPSPTPQPSTPTTYTLTGRVLSSTAPISGALVKISDGPNANRTATTNASGQYTLTGLQLSGFTAVAAATNFVTLGKSVTLTSDQTVDFVLTPTPLFARAGSGDTVFDIPASVSRLTITADYGGHSSNFIVKIAGRLVVNELVGTGWNQTHFQGTYLTTGGTAEITNSSGVSWSFTEVR